MAARRAIAADSCSYFALNSASVWPLVDISNSEERGVAYNPSINFEMVISRALAMTSMFGGKCYVPHAQYRRCSCGQDRIGRQSPPAKSRQQRRLAARATESCQDVVRLFHRPRVKEGMTISPRSMRTRAMSIIRLTAAPGQQAKMGCF